jgi:hypothetical protein
MCANLLPNELLHLTLERFPEIAMMINGNGESIDHVICGHPQSTPNMIHTLVYHCSVRIFAIQDSSGDLPLHLVNADTNHCEEIIQLLLHYYPQAITIQNMEMHTPLTARWTRESPSNLKAMIQYSDHNIARHVFLGIHRHRIIREGGNMNAFTHAIVYMTVIEKVFLLLQRHLSSLCNNLPHEVNSATLQSLHWTSKFLSRDIEYFYCLMKVMYYNFIEWPTRGRDDTSTNDFTITPSPLPVSSTGAQALQRGSTMPPAIMNATTVTMNSTIIIHSSLFWCQFPLFTKMILQRHPEIAFIYDIYGNLPLHVVVHYNLSSSSSSGVISTTTKKIPASCAKSR